MKRKDICTSFEDSLGNFVEGDMANESYSRFSEHLDTCKECSRLKSEYEFVVKAASTIEKHQITKDIRQRLRTKLERETGIRFVMR